MFLVKISKKIILHKWKNYLVCSLIIPDENCFFFFSTPQSVNQLYLCPYKEQSFLYLFLLSFDLIYFCAYYCLKAEFQVDRLTDGTAFVPWVPGYLENLIYHYQISDKKDLES